MFLKPPLPHNEAARLEVLRQLSLLDTPPEQEYDDLTHLAAFLCRAPMASITLIDEHRQWFKAKVGLQNSETARNISFCAHAILGSDLFIVPDATQDERFRDNPLVLGDPHIRFYAGMPLNTAEGATIGTLCVIDREPRDLPESSCLALRVLGRQVVAHIQIRRQLSQLQQVSAERLKIERRLRISQNKLRNANLKLRELASTDALTGLRNRRAF
jgi:GAF domain-containing protein